MVEATVDDIAWADVVVFASPTRSGPKAGRLRRLLVDADPLASCGALSDKVVSVLVTTATLEGGAASPLSMAHVFQTWRCVFVGPAAPDHPDPVEVARRQGRRAVDVARRLMAGTDAVERRGDDLPEAEAADELAP